MRSHRYKPSTVGKHQSAIFTHFSPWQLHRLHIIRPRHYKSFPIGRYLFFYYSYPFFPPLVIPQITYHEVLSLQIIYGGNIKNLLIGLFEIVVINLRIFIRWNLAIFHACFRGNNGYGKKLCCYNSVTILFFEILIYYPGAPKPNHWELGSKNPNWRGSQTKFTQIIWIQNKARINYTAKLYYLIPGSKIY